MPTAAEAAPGEARQETEPQSRRERQHAPGVRSPGLLTLRICSDQPICPPLPAPGSAVRWQSNTSGHPKVGARPRGPAPARPPQAPCSIAVHAYIRQPGRLLAKASSRVLYAERLEFTIFLHRPLGRIPPLKYLGLVFPPRKRSLPTAVVLGSSRSPDVNTAGGPDGFGAADDLAGDGCDFDAE